MRVYDGYDEYTSLRDVFVYLGSDYIQDNNDFLAYLDIEEYTDNLTTDDNNFDIVYIDSRQLEGNSIRNHILGIDMNWNYPLKEVIDTNDNEILLN